MSAINWFAIYVKSRHEFKVHELLQKRHIETFLPTVERIRKWKDRKKVVKFPLFNGYLFVHMEKKRERILEVLKTPGVVRFLKGVSGDIEPVPEEQIIPIKIAIENKREINPYPYLKEGQRVRIKKGPLEGFEGIFQRVENRHYVVISIDILQRSASLKIEASEIELI